MKNIHIILTTLLGTMIALASCQREDVPHNGTPEENGTPISFSAIHASLDTKGDDGETSEGGSETGTTTPEISSFHVWASRTYGQTGSPTTDNTIFSGEEVTYKSGVWQYSPVRYWQTGSYQFVAVSQMTDIKTSYTGSITNSSLNLSFTSPGWNLSTTPADLILAPATVSGDSQRNNNANVAFTFDHQLAKVKFSAKNNDSREPSITITGVKISGNSKIASSMTYNPTSRSATWALSNTDGWSISITPVDLKTDEFEDITDYVLVFPENLQADNRSFTVEITFNEILGGVTTTGNVKSATIKPTWAAGYKYDYNITLTSDHLTFSEPTVTEWVTVEEEISDSEITM